MWNCGGLTSSVSHSKATFFEKDFKNDFDAAFFIETHHMSDTTIPPQLLRYQNTHTMVHSFVSPNEKYAGILGLIHNDFDVIECKDLLQGRILNIKLKRISDKSLYNISVIYMYTNNKISTTKINHVVSKLREEIVDHSNNFILGDFNFIDHEKDKRNGLNSTDKLACKSWLPFIQEFDMIDPYREQYPNKRIWSFIGTGKAGNSRIDRLYVNSENMTNITNMKYFQTPFGGHRIFSFTISLSSPKGKGYYKMNTSIITDNQFRGIVTDTLQQLDTLQTNDPIHRWTTFLLAIKSKSVTYSKIKSKTRRKLKENLQKQIFNLEENDLNSKPGNADHYDYLRRKLKQIEDYEIEGYQRRVKFLSSYEKAEPDIAFYSKLESKKGANDSITQLAEDEHSKICTDKDDIMRIATKYYKNLYTPNKVNTNTQDRLLKNIKNKISQEQKQKLDAPITLEEIKTAIFQMKPGKSPGLDGIPVEFYQEFWDEIKDLYFAYINRVKVEAFPTGRNTSLIKLIYKKTGEIILLRNYRPISLMNVDIKILSKTLANRLMYVLPSIIHRTQTAVYGRQIDETIHMIRDLIDLANKENIPAAFIFLDQEKAFDRVHHNFLYKTLRAFGFGDVFIHWIYTLYNNASSFLNINGFFSPRIPLNRGIRQGCPLSSLLYVLVIEVFAIQLRLNPNIIGFQIGGEKIVSTHYMDDATITITQNRCFKEVIKEIANYEDATGAKINYEKTKGLWTGAWIRRRTCPLQIKWTNKNIKNLGIYFGNDDPHIATFKDIIPSINKRLNYWKQFKLSLIGKTRVADIFLASKLIYAIKFYPLPSHEQKTLQDNIFSFVNFPQKVVTVSQTEMWKIKSHGGLKLINIEIKSNISKVKWLIDIASKPNLKTSFDLFNRLVGTQKGHISGHDLLFLQTSYFQRTFKTNGIFYKDALLSLSKLDKTKGIPNINRWDSEHIFYNPLITTKTKNIIKPTQYFENRDIFTLDKLFEEKAKETRGQPYDKKITKLYDSITLNLTTQEDCLYINTGDEIKFSNTTHKQIYEAVLISSNKDHHSQTKWFYQLNTLIPWDKVWENVHNFLSCNHTRTLIWQQLHLNFYTQFSYNKWHNVNNQCPLCHKIPDSIFHLILCCDITATLWNDIEPTLKKLYALPISDEEKAMGILQHNKNTGVIIRNWVTFLLRRCIADFERNSFKNPSYTNTVNKIKRKFNHLITLEIDRKKFRYKHENKLTTFEKFFTHANVLCEKHGDEDYMINNIF